MTEAIVLSVVILVLLAVALMAEWGRRQESAKRELEQVKTISLEAKSQGLEEENHALNRDAEGNLHRIRDLVRERDELRSGGAKGLRANPPPKNKR